MGKAERRISLTAKVLIGAFLVIVLAGMILPALQRANGGRRASCLSMLKQIMLGIKLYTEDYDGSYPTHMAQDEEGRTSYKDLGILYPNYISSLDVFTCAESGDHMPHDRWNDEHDNKPFLPEEARHLSYAYGLNKNAKNKAWTDNAPASTRVLADRPATSSLTNRSNHKRRGRNVAFADGRVKWLGSTAPLDSDPENPDPGKHGIGPDWWSER
jgi:prepilin-type processing-associated H-X9-DG protein